MEYLFGTIATLLTLLFLRHSLREDKLPKIKKISYRQSNVFEIVRPYVDFGLGPIVVRETQAIRHEKESSLRVLFIENRAYWIKDNSLLVSEVIDGQIDGENAKIVDTMSLNKVELEQIVFIVEKLTEGTKNDGGRTGES